MIRRTAQVVLLLGALATGTDLQQTEAQHRPVESRVSAPAAPQR